MKKLFLKHFLVFSVLSMFVLAPAIALAEGPDLWGDDGANKDAIRSELGYESGTEEDPRIIAASIIRVLMTFLGIIAVGIIIWGGFRWMTAGGNEDQTADARKIIQAGIIGLLIILGAWALASWVLTTITTEILS